MGLLDGKVALITGAARGQGRAHAVTSAREGADVVVLDIAAQMDTVIYPMASKDDLEETVRQVEAVDRRAVAVQGDVRSQSDLDAAVATAIAEFGKLDILIANHGIWGLNEFWELTEAQWKEMLDVNVLGVWKAAKAVAPHMIERNAGSIVITSSMNGFEPGTHYAHYSTSKFGAIGLTKNVARELAPHGVRCNSVAPGVINTPMLNNPVTLEVFLGAPGGTLDDLHTAGSHYHLLKGAGVVPAQAVADAALWLNSDLARWITGITIPVDAGHSLLSGFNHEPT